MSQLEIYKLAKKSIDSIHISELDDYIVFLKEQERTLLNKFKIGYAYIRKNLIDTALIYLGDFFEDVNFEKNIIFALKWKEVQDWGHGIHTVTEYEIPDNGSNNDNNGCGTCCLCGCMTICCCITGKEFGCIDGWSDIWGVITTCPCCCACCGC